MFSGRFDLFNNDPLLPGLGSLTAERIQQAVSENVPSYLLGASANSYAVSNVRYKPRQKLVIGMTSGGASRPIGIRVVPKGKINRRFQEAKSYHPEHTFLFEGIDAIGWVYPAERKLNLKPVADTAVVEHALAQNQHHGFKKYKLKAIELIHFVPEHTYTAKLSVQTEFGKVGEQYLKVYYNDQGAKTATIMEQLSLDSATKDFQTPELVHYSAENRFLIQSGLYRNSNVRLTIADAATVLAQFHEMKINAPYPAMKSHEQKRCELTSLLEDTAPMLITGVEALYERMEPSESRLRESANVVLHGDPHLGNIFPLVNGKVGIIDLDGVYSGPPENDLASFFAFQLWCAIREKRDPHELLPDYLKLIDTYNCRAANAVSLARAWFALANKLIIERIQRGIARGKVCHIGELSNFLRLASECVNNAECADD